MCMVYLSFHLGLPSCLAFLKTILKEFAVLCYIFKKEPYNEDICYLLKLHILYFMHIYDCNLFLHILSIKLTKLINSSVLFVDFSSCAGRYICNLCIKTILFLTPYTISFSCAALFCLRLNKTLYRSDGSKYSCLVPNLLQ